ncbi:MAG: transglycosylase SLT domain-containing protein [Treponema sp.]|nr:transglycosylase SLT domain-containing protein [Treponema sp.]
MNTENNGFFRLACGIVTFSLLLVVVGLGVCIFLPADKENAVATIPAVMPESEPNAKKIEEDMFSTIAFSEKLQQSRNRIDSGLLLYRNNQGRSAVEWFYTHITEDRDVAIAILEYADKYDVPLSLAFALAHTESNYRANAMHVNKNNSIDRGLFQLNNRSFPDLKENDFYDPKTSARYGMSHLRFCLDNAGNEIAALAMYNAGTNKVRNNNTPQMTLNYISRIENYRSLLEESFNAEVLSFYQMNNFMADKLLAKN